MKPIEDAMIPIDELTGQTKSFAVDCYENRTLEELQQPHTPEDANPEECKKWRISPRHWSLAIEAALKCRLEQAS